MKTFLSALLLLILLQSTRAQTFEWLATEPLDYSFNPEMIQFATTVDLEEHAYLFGIKEHIDFYSKSYGILRLNKYDSDGTSAWEREIDGLAAVAGITADDAGNVYLIGTFRASLNFWDEGSLEYNGSTELGFLVKVGPDGSYLWGMNLFDLYAISTVPADIRMDNAGFVWVSHVGGTDAYVSQLDDSGNLIGEIHQSSAGLISGFDVDANGNVFVAGSCSTTSSLFGGVNYATPFSYSMYLAKYDDLGVPQWVEFVEDVTCIRPIVRVDESGYAYMSGSLTNSTQFGTISAGGPSWVYDFFITRVSPDGMFEWLLEVPQVGGGDATNGPLNHLDVTPEGNAVFGGMMRGTIDWGNGIVSSSNMYYDAFLMEVNSLGEIQWEKSAGGDYYDIVHSVAVSQAGNIFFSGLAGGTVVFDTLNHSSTDFTYPILAKVNMGFTTGIHEEGRASGNLSVFPNPGKGGTITIRTESQILSRNAEIRCINSSGELVFREKFNAGSSFKKIDSSNWPPGIYVAVVLDGDRHPEPIRFVVR